MTSRNDDAPFFADQNDGGCGISQYVPNSLREMVEYSPGIVITPNRSNPAIVPYLKNKMKDLAEAGVTALFVQTCGDIEPQQQLELFSAYNRDPAAPMPEGMRRSLDSNLLFHAGSAPDTGMADLLDAARANGITVLPASLNSPDPLTPIKSQNERNAKLIKDYMGKRPLEERFAFITHELNTELANKSSDESECDRAVGVDKLLGVPCISFSHAATRFPAARITATSDSNSYEIVTPDTLVPEKYARR